MTLEHLESKLQEGDQLDRKLAKLARAIRDGRGLDIPLPKNNKRMKTMEYLIDRLSVTPSTLDNKLAEIVHGILNIRQGNDIALPLVNDKKTNVAYKRSEQTEIFREELILKTRPIVEDLPNFMPISYFVIPQHRPNVPNFWLSYYESLSLREKNIITRSFNSAAREIRSRNIRIFGDDPTVRFRALYVEDFRNLKGFIESGEIPVDPYVLFTAEVFDRSNLPEKSE